MLIDSLEFQARKDEQLRKAEMKARHEAHNQRLSTVTGKYPLLALNPTGLALMLMSRTFQQEQMDGMA